LRAALTISYDQLMQIQAVIFDRDNTLVFFARAQVARLEAQIAALAPGLPAGAAVRAWASWPGPWPRLAAEEPDFWRGFWAALGAAHSLAELQTAALIEQVGALYHTCFAAFPDAAPALAALHDAGLRLAVLTNFELPSVDRTLAHAGLDPALFEVTLTSTSLGLAKPDPRAFRAAAAALDLAPAACAFVDDLAENVAAARSIGMRAYQIDRSSRTGAPVAGQISSLLPLTELLLPPSVRA
jgi:putative hydrolase of the HAD superfamily